MLSDDRLLTDYRIGENAELKLTVQLNEWALDPADKFERWDIVEVEVKEEWRAAIIVDVHKDGTFDVFWNSTQRGRVDEAICCGPAVVGWKGKS